MIREDKFLISHAPYAVDLYGLEVRQTRGTRCRGDITAVWFRRKSGVVTAQYGVLWDYQDREPDSAEAFLEAHDDGRYGGQCYGRWDGESFWGNVSLKFQQEQLEVLRPMLENYPAVPPGFDGWWTFKGAKS
jgi:hypothetical protein